MKEAVRYPYQSRAATAFLDALELAKWSMQRIGNLNPSQCRLPTILKRRVIASYARRHKLQTFVESGTYLGGTVAFMRRYCPRVYSVEFQTHLAEAAQKRFAQDPAIRILQGDGSTWMPQIVAELQEPALFWLDGHFAAGTARAGEVACPTLHEISAVLTDTRYPHVLLIDDAREFKGDGDYPTLDSLEQFIRSARADMTLQVKNDIVRVTHKTTS